MVQTNKARGGDEYEVLKRPSRKMRRVAVLMERAPRTPAPTEVPGKASARKRRDSSAAALKAEVDGGKGRGGRDAARIGPARKRAAEELGEAGEEDGRRTEGGIGAGLPAKREWKKGKHLLPPYIDSGRPARREKPADSPTKESPSLCGGNIEKKVAVPLDSVGNVEGVLELVRHFGVDFFHGSLFPEAAKGFLGLFRSSVFVQGAEYQSYKEHTCPMEKADFDIGGAGLVSDKSDAVEQGECVLKGDQDESAVSSVEKVLAKADFDIGGASLVLDKSDAVEQGECVRKGDQDESAVSSVEREKTCTAATVGCDLSTATAIATGQVRPEDITSHMTAGGAAKIMVVGAPNQDNELAFKSPSAAAMVKAIKPGEEEEQEQAGSRSVLKSTENAGDTLSFQSAKKNEDGMVDATNLETGLQMDMNAQSAVVDVPAKSVQMEATKPEIGIQVDMNEQSVAAEGLVRTAQKEVTTTDIGIQVDMDDQGTFADVPVRTVQMEATTSEIGIQVDMSEQSSVLADVLVSSGSLPTHGDISQPGDAYKDHATANAKACTVQEPHAFLKAMAPEMCMEAVASSGSLPTHGNICQPGDANKDHATANAEVCSVQEPHAFLKAMAPEHCVEAVATTGTSVVATSHALKDGGQKTS